MTSTFEAVVGQTSTLERLELLAKNPPHAYILVGPAGTGKMAAALGFAALLLCENGRCGECRTCRLAVQGHHPDVTVMTHEGASVRIEEAGAIRTAATRSPIEGSRKVLILEDFHEANTSASALLLKTIEEPPASTYFIVLTHDVPLELVTIASRCVRLEFQPVPIAAIEGHLIARGCSSDVAREAAEGSDGNVRRAELLAADPAFGARRSFWAHIPERLDGTGATVDSLVAEINSLVEQAGAPLAAKHEAELAELEARVKATGERGSGRKDLERTHTRELKRFKRDELRFGLGELSRAYRDRLATSSHPGRVVAAIGDITEMAKHLVHNPNETLQLQALLLRLGDN